MQYYQFDCGCKFPIEENDKVRIKLDIQKVPFNCKRTWDLISSGYTKGVFQLESNLGKQWTKRLKPENIEHLTALGALLRPGCLRAMDEHGISMTEHYCRRKNGEEPVEIFHPSLDIILRPTYGVLTYQEQAMQIAQAIANFDLQSADELRKAIGKKLPEEMEKVRIKFMAGCEQAKIVTLEEATQIFGWIKESQRYSFNKSHAACYAVNGYYCAYCKAHFPVQTYTSWLYHAPKKQAKKGENPKREVRDLINEAKLMNIDVLPPDIFNLRPHFHTDGKIITFGLSDIKNIGKSLVAKIKEVITNQEVKYGKEMQDWTWFQFLVRVGPIKQETGRIGETALANLISAGALRNYEPNRTKMLAELKTWAKLSTGEANFICNNSDKFTNLLDAMKAAAPLKKEGGACHNEERKQTVQSLISLLEHPPSKLEDSPNWIAGTEEILLGIAITCSRIDACDISAINASCRDFIDGNIKNSGSIMLGVEVQSMQEIKTKKGKAPGSKMARLTISDGTCAIDAVSWPESYKEIGHLLTNGNTVIVQGYKDRKQGSFVVQNAWQAEFLVGDCDVD
jgi:DNA polymerase III alpha subunit